MGLQSASVSVTRYRVEGNMEAPVMENIVSSLTRHVITDIDGEPDQKAVGWTSFETPFEPSFGVDTLSIGQYLIFSLRIDKKSIPAKVIQKRMAAETAKRLAETGRPQLSRNEKQAVKEHVLHDLCLKIPAAPSMYDVVWQYEAGILWFYSTQKSANEDLETLFNQTFKMTLIRLFPYTLADADKTLSDGERNLLAQLAPSIVTG